MRFLQIHTFYDAYLKEIYRRTPGLEELDFEAQIDTVLADGFSASHMLKRPLSDLGYDARLAIANCLPSQLQWARANGMTAVTQADWVHEIAKAQVEALQPDILYLSDPITFDSRFVRRLSWKPRLVLGWRAATIPAGTDWSEFDVMLSHLSGCREQALQIGARSVRHFHPGFPQFIADAVKGEQKAWDVVFSGQWTPEHGQRNQIIQNLAHAARHDASFTFGLFLACPRPEDLPDDVSEFNQGARWGLDMHRALMRGRIVVNAEIDLANREAGNMRLFETTGTGTFLLTEHHDNIGEYFEPGVEIETYRSEAELMEKIAYYLAHPAEREAIARRGQARSLSQYAMEGRAREFDRIVREALTAAWQVPGTGVQTAAIPKASITDELQQGLELLNQGNAARALQSFDRVLALAPHQNGVQYGRAVALARMGDKYTAATVLQDLLARVPKHRKACQLLTEIAAPDLSDLLLQMKDAIGAGQIGVAFDLGIKAKSLKRPMLGLDALRARCFLGMGQVADAREALNEELRHFPGNTEARALLQDVLAMSPGAPPAGLGDPEFQALLAAIRPYTMLSEERLFSLFSLAKRACELNLPGNFVECGVAGGGSTALLAIVIKRYSKQPRCIYAFDSFEGMPAPTAEDTSHGVSADDTGWGTGTCAAPEASVRQICAQLDVLDLVKPIKGYFQDTLPRMRNWVGMIAVLHMDADWYESTKVILDNLYDRLVDDSLIQVDDYGYWEGCKKALHEFESERGLTFKLCPIDGTGVWFQKPDRFATNPEIAPALVQEFLEDDPVQAGIVSQMSPNERYQLFHILRTTLPRASDPLRFVEIGSYGGASLYQTYMALKQGASPIQGFAVDPASSPGLQRVIQHGQGDLYHLPLLSQDALPLLKELFEADQNYPEFILVDGDHSYEGVHRDILNYYPLLKPGGIMMFHDFLPPIDDNNREAIFFHHGGKDPGIRQACEELMEQAYHAEALDLPLLYPADPTQTQAHLPIIPGVYSTVRAYRKPR